MLRSIGCFNRFLVSQLTESHSNSYTRHRVYYSDLIPQVNHNFYLSYNLLFGADSYVRQKNLFRVHFSLAPVGKVCFNVADDIVP